MQIELTSVDVTQVCICTKWQYFEHLGLTQMSVCVFLGSEEKISDLC